MGVLPVEGRPPGPLPQEEARHEFVDELLQGAVLPQRHEGPGLVHLRGTDTGGERGPGGLVSKQASTLFF